MVDMQAQITLEGRDSASAAIREVGRALEETKGSAEHTNVAFERIKSGFESGMGFAAGITGFRELKDVLEGLGDATVNFNASLEQTTIRLENLTGSAAGAAETIGRIKELSDASPFTFKELETANERLLRFNFSTERAAELIKVASDAAAGMGAGAAGVDTITEAFGRMNSRTELTTRGIMALIGMGVPAFDMLAKGLGITTAQAEDLTKKGLIPSIDAIKILSEQLEQKYPAMAAKIGDTFGSLKKTIADTMDFMFAELGKPVFDVLEISAKDWLAWLQSADVKSAVTDFASGLADAIKHLGDLFNMLKANGALEDVKVAWGSLKDAGKELFGLVEDSFIPTQSKFNGTLAGNPDSAEMSAGKAAAAIKGFTGDLKELATGVKDAVDWLKPAGDGLNAVNQAGKDVALMFHNELIEALKDVLSPLQLLVDTAKEMELLFEKTFHIKIDIPGQAGLQAFLDSVHPIAQLGSGFTGTDSAASGVGGPGGIPNISAAGGAIPAPGDKAGWAAWLQQSGAIPTDLINDPTFLNILLTGAQGESTLTGNRTQPIAKDGSGGAAGLFQFDPGGMGRGLSVDFLNSPAGTLYEAQQIIPKYAAAYRSQTGQSMTGAAQAAYVADQAEAPAGAWPGGSGDENYRRAYSVIMGGAGSAYPYGPSPVAGGAGFIGPPTMSDGTIPLNALQLAELNKTKAAATGDVGFTELAAKSAAAGDWLEASQRAEQKKITGLESTAARATTGIDTKLADTLGADLTGQTSGDMFSKRAVDEDIKVRKAALAEKMQDEAVANQIAVAADALRWKRTDEDQQLVSARAREDDNILHNQQLAHEALLHSRTLQDTEIQYQQTLQLEATAHARALEDEKILDNEKLAAVQLAHSRQLQDEQILANEKLAINQTAHQRQLQDQALAEGEALAGTATAHSRQLQDTEAAYQLNRSIGKNPANEAALRAAAADAADQLAHQRGLQDVEQRYQDGLKDAALAKSRQDAEKEQAYKDQLADTALQTSRSNADKEAAYQQTVRATALIASRADADKEAIYKEGLAKTALEHSRGLQDVEVQYQMGLAHTALMRKRDEEDVVRAESRAKEDGLIAHQIELAAAARAFARKQKAEQDAFDKILADEAYNRQVAQLLAEAAIQKKNIADKLVLDKQAAVESAQADRDIKKAAFDEAAAGIIAKSKAAVETAGGDFAPIEAKMLDTVHAMDLAFATAHSDSSAALVDLAKQAVDALATGGTVPKAITDTTGLLVASLGQGSPAAQAIEVSDQAVELFGQQFGLTWEQARPLLGQIEQGIYTNMGENGLIPKHILASDQAVEKFAHQWGISWDEARPILETESTRIKTSFGIDVPDAMGKSGSAAIKLNTDIQSIQDKTIHITTVYNAGKAPADLTGSNAGYAAAGQNFAVASISDPSRGGGSSSSGGAADFSTYAGRQAYRDSHPGAIVDASGAYTPPGRAAGGPVYAGKAYMVGELGPELFTPGASGGNITPNGGAIDYERLARAIAAEMQNVNLTVGVDDIHSGLLRKARRGSALGLA